jgi:glutaredoxin
MAISTEKQGIRFRHFTGFMTLVFVIHSSPVLAATMYKWVDTDGNVTYQDSPPPPNSEILLESKIEDVSLTSGAENASVAEMNPITLYTTPNCETCDLVRMNLVELRVPFTERKLNSDRAAQQELQDKTGQLVAPSLFMGDTRIMAFSQEHLKLSAVDAGYFFEETEEDEQDLFEYDDPDFPE